MNTFSTETKLVTVIMTKALIATGLSTEATATLVDEAAAPHGPEFAQWFADLFLQIDEDMSAIDAGTADTIEPRTAAGSLD